MEDLKHILEQTNSAVQLIKSKPRQLQEVISILDSFEAMSENIPKFSSQLLRGIGDYWDALTTLDNDPQIHSVWLNITHQRVMMSKTWVIQYLFEDCRTQVINLSAHHRHIFRSNGDMSCDCMQYWENLHDDTSSWLAKLTLDLSAKLSVMGNSHKWEVSSAIYIPALDPPVKVSYQLATKRNRIPADDAQFDWDVTWNVLHLITAWLKIPAGSTIGLIKQAGIVSEKSLFFCQLFGNFTKLIPSGL